MNKETSKLIFRENSGYGFLHAITAFIFIASIPTLLLSAFIHPLIPICFSLIAGLGLFYWRRSKIYFLSFYADFILQEFRFIKTEIKIPYTSVEKISKLHLTKSSNFAIQLKGRKKPLFVYVHKDIMDTLVEKGNAHGFKVFKNKGQA